MTNKVNKVQDYIYRGLRITIWHDDDGYFYDVKRQDGSIYADGEASDAEEADSLAKADADTMFDGD